MKYVIKCSYCGHSYIVDAKEDEKDFQCETCGGQNSIEDVVERIEEPVIIEKEVIKKVVVKEKPDPDLQTIKNFDISKYEVADDSDMTVGWGSSDEKTLSPLVSTIIVIATIFFSLIALNAPEEETEWEAQQRRTQELLQEWEDEAKDSREAYLAQEVINQWMTAMNDKDLPGLLSCYNIPKGSVFGLDELSEMIQNSELNALWGTDTQINNFIFLDYSKFYTGYLYPRNGDISSIEYKVEFSNDCSHVFTVENAASEDMAIDMKISLEDAVVASDVKVRTALNEYPTEVSDEDFDEIFEDFYAILFIDNMRIDASYEEIEDEDGQKYGQYTIPLMATGEHVFEVHTILGDLSMSYEVTDDEQIIVLDALQVTEEQRTEMAATLLNTWQQVQTAALNYAEPAAFRQFFHSRISNEEIEELAKQIRMEHDLRGNYEGAVLTNLTIPDSSFCATDYDTFILPVTLDYQSSNENHATGTCSSKVAVTRYAGSWQIYEKYDNSFFTLVEPVQEEAVAP